VIYEDGLWGLIFRSTKPEAKAIKKRVKAILREIRATGSCSAELTHAEQLLAQAQALVAQERQVQQLTPGLAEVSARVDGIEQRTGRWSALGFAKRKVGPLTAVRWCGSGRPLLGSPAPRASSR
jgi:hypothetical protein